MDALESGRDEWGGGLTSHGERTSMGEFPLHLQPPNPYWVDLSGNHGKPLHNLFGHTNAVHIRLTPQGGYQVEQVVRGNTTSPRPMCSRPWTMIPGALWSA